MFLHNLTDSPHSRQILMVGDCMVQLTHKLGIVGAGCDVEEPYLKRCTHHYHLIFFHCVAWVLGFLIGGFYRYAEGILSKVIMGKRTKLVRLYLFCQPH